MHIILHRGSSDINPRGEGLCEYLMAKGLLVQSKEKAPTFITRVKQKVLDLTRCSIGVQRIIYDWRMSDEPSLLDHRYILYRIGTPQVLLRDTDWSKIKSELRSKTELSLV